MNTQKDNERITIENDCVMNDPVTGEGIAGQRLYDDGFKFAEVYHADLVDVQSMVKALNEYDKLKADRDALLEALKNLVDQDLIKCPLDDHYQECLEVIAQAEKGAK